jgi:hypothetical protein
MCVALGLAGISGRARPESLLRRATGLRAALLGLAALTAAVGGPPDAVIGLAAASSPLSGTYRPLQVTILSWLVRTPAELTSSNAMAAMLENSGALAGPLLAGGPARLRTRLAAAEPGQASRCRRPAAAADRRGGNPCRASSAGNGTLRQRHRRAHGAADDGAGQSGDDNGGHGPG